MSRMADHFFGDRPYPASPGFKENTTSRDAARAISAKAPTLRNRVLAAIKDAGPAGLTADEAADKLGETVHAVRPRLTELGPKHANLIESTGMRRPNASGLMAKVWRAKTEGTTR